MSVLLNVTVLLILFVCRYSDPNNIIKKKLTTPVPAYGNWVESQNIYELESIKRNPNAIHMESLTIRERILGRQNPEVPHPVIFRGAVFADNARFDRCLDLWLHALDLRQMNGISVVKDLLRFAQVFSQMCHVGVEVAFGHVVKVLSAAVAELGRNKQKIANPGPKDDPETIKVSVDSYLSVRLSISL